MWCILKRVSDKYEDTGRRCASRKEGYDALKNEGQDYNGYIVIREHWLEAFLSH